DTEPHLSPFPTCGTAASSLSPACGGRLERGLTLRVRAVESAPSLTLPHKRGRGTVQHRTAHPAVLRRFEHARSQCSSSHWSSLSQAPTIPNPSRASIAAAP